MKIIKFINTVSRRIASPANGFLKKTPPPALSLPTLPPPPAEAVQDDAEDKQEGPSTVPQPLSAKRRRALLIGIRFTQDGVSSPTAPTSSAAPTILRKGKAKLKQKCRKLNDPMALRGCHRDVLDMKELLLSIYGYKEKDIQILMDDDAPNRTVPTRDNIMAAMDNLVKDAEPGDAFFFLFAGHSTQEDTNNVEEEDGKDEFIITHDNQRIQDDELRAHLVDPLPAGCRLTAVFDSCHSASLLDLPHHRCNRVYVPWVNKGNRRSNTKWNINVRRHAAPVSPRMSPRMSPRGVGGVFRFPRRASPLIPTPKWKKTSIDQMLATPSKTKTLSPIPTPHNTRSASLTGNAPKTGAAGPLAVAASAPNVLSTSHTHAQAHSKSQTPVESRKASAVGVGVGVGVVAPPMTLHDKLQKLSVRTTDIFWLSSESSETSPIPRYGSSPEPIYCTGECAPRPESETTDPLVISLSAAKDSQRAWEDSTGASMTQSLIRILSSNPHPSLSTLLKRVSHETHRSYLSLHAKAREYKAKAKIANLKLKAMGKKEREVEQVEMDNFQDPQISSLHPLDTENMLWSP